MTIVYRPKGTRTEIKLVTREGGAVCASIADEQWESNDARPSGTRGSVVAVVPDGMPPGTIFRLAHYHRSLRERANGITA